MKISNVAKSNKKFIEQTITVQDLPNKEYLVEAKAIPMGQNKEQLISMKFSQNGFNAFLGSLLAFEQKELNK